MTTQTDPYYGALIRQDGSRQRISMMNFNIYRKPQEVEKDGLILSSPGEPEYHLEVVTDNETFDIEFSDHSINKLVKIGQHISPDNIKMIADLLFATIQLDGGVKADRLGPAASGVVAGIVQEYSRMFKLANPKCELCDQNPHEENCPRRIAEDLAARANDALAILNFAREEADLLIKAPQDSEHDRILARGIANRLLQRAEDWPNRQLKEKS